MGQNISISVSTYAGGIFKNEILHNPIFAEKRKKGAIKS